MKPATLAIAKARSNNAKLGEAATTYAAQTSCPADCVFFDGGGCYAESGAVGKFVTAPLNAAAAECEHDAIDVALAEAEAIDALEVIPGRPLRLHTVGDCATNLAALILAAAAKRYTDAGGGPVWTYSHAWRSVDRAAWGTVSVLASCETGEDVNLARSRGYATALVVERFESDKLYDWRRNGEEGTEDATGGHGGLEAGARQAVRADVALDGPLHRPAVAPDAATARLAEPLSVLPCPAQTRDVPCSDCGLCFDDAGLKARGYSIGFELHGTPFTVSRGVKALRDPADPLRRKTTRELIPAYLAERPNASDVEMARAFGVTAGSVTQMRHKLERAA